MHIQTFKNFIPAKNNNLNMEQITEKILRDTAIKVSQTLYKILSPHTLQAINKQTNVKTKQQNMICLPTKSYNAYTKIC